MALTKEKRLTPPMRITGLLQGQWANQILRTAVELDIFTPLKKGGLSCQELSARLKVDNRGLTLLLNALVALEFLRREGDRYELVELSLNYLVKDSSLYFGDYILEKRALDAAWANLEQAVKTGKALERVNDQASGEEFFRYLAAAIFPISYTTAQMLADELGLGSGQGAVRVLDLAAGSGVWSIPMAQSNENVTVDALDFPGILEVTQKFASKFGVAHRYNYLPGNWRDVKLEPATYDVVTLGHILHCEGKRLSQELLAACFAALKPGGTVVIAEFLSNEDRTGPAFAQMFAINMFLMTDSGCIFTVSELEQMLLEAGFRGTRRLSLPYWGEESPLLLAQK